MSYFPPVAAWGGGLIEHMDRYLLYNEEWTGNSSSQRTAQSLKYVVWNFEFQLQTRLDRHQVGTISKAQK